MDKENLKELLLDEETIKIVSNIRTKYSHNITESNFFDIFFEVFRTLGIEVTHKIETSICESKIKIGEETKVISKYFLKIKDVNERSYLYDYGLFKTKISSFNIHQKDMSFMESSEALIDIFLSLLGTEEGLCLD